MAKPTMDPLAFPAQDDRGRRSRPAARDGAHLRRDAHERRSLRDRRCGVRRAQPRTHQPAQRVPQQALGHPRRIDRSGHPQAAIGLVLSGLAARAAPARGARARGGRRAGVRRGHLDRWVDDLVRAPGIDLLSKSAVSEMASSLDEGVRAFCDRPLDGAPYRHLWLDALALRVREAGRIVSVWAVIADRREHRREARALGPGRLHR